MLATDHSRSRKRQLLLLLIFVLCAAALLLWLHHRAGLSPYAGQPSGQFLCTADADRYPLDTDQITLRVSNVGDYEGELDKPAWRCRKTARGTSSRPRTRPARPPTCCTSLPALLPRSTSP